VPYRLPSGLLLLTRPRAAVAVLAAAMVATVAALTARTGGQRGVAMVSNLGELFFAGAAAVSIALLARRTTGRERASWSALAAGCAAWAAGQGAWSWYELRLGRELPFPSLGDVGFLLFPVGACVALWLLPARASQAERGRRLLDSLTVTAALSLVWWSTALGAVARAGAADPLALTVSLAYPASDLVVLALTVIVMSRSCDQRRTLSLFGLGIGAIALADSVFAYQTALGTYGGTLADVGWVVGFGLLALAPFAHTTQTAGEPAARVTDRAPSPLPYLPLLAAGAVVTLQLGRGHRPSTVELALAGLTAAFVLVRQHVVMRENGRLLAALSHSEAQLRHQAFHDGLTGLANRALFHDRVVHALDLHRRDRRSLAVLFCDLDDFKLVNDTLGHQAGDELLVRVAERLRGSLRAGDTLARLGGDEFAVLLEDGGDPLVVAEHVIGVLGTPFRVGGTPVQTGVSVGLAAVDRSAETPTADELLAHADTAMYAAKRTGKGRFCVFVPGMELEEVTDEGIRRRLAAAIAERRVTLAFQPITDLATGALAGFEALARWREGQSDVPPDVFVAAAERTGLIDELTQLVLDDACAQLSAWDRAGARRDFTVAVNVPPSRIVDKGFPEQVRAALDRHGVAPERLVLEITESGLLTDLESARRVTARLNELGVELSLDDFGTGYSSLTHLSQIPLRSLKIDRAFVEHLGDDETQVRFAQALVRFGTHLGLEVIAEGVEGAEQLEALRDLGCPRGQGYLLGRPAPADAWGAQVLPRAAPVVPSQRSPRTAARRA